MFVVLLAMVASAAAKEDKNKSGQQPAKQERKPVMVTTEFGLLGGASYTWLKTSRPEGMTAAFSQNFALGASLQFRLNIGKYFGLQPEVTYNYSIIKVQDEANSFSSKIKSNTVQIPVLLSLRLAMFRINAGPVFTIMDDPHYMLGSTKMLFGKLYPTMTYTAGIAVRLLKHMIIDLRYYGQFGERKSSNAYMFNEAAEAQYLKTRHSSLQLRIGYVF